MEKHDVAMDLQVLEGDFGSKSRFGMARTIAIFS
jgi:hypothetical protein